MTHGEARQLLTWTICPKASMELHASAEARSICPGQHLPRRFDQLLTTVIFVGIAVFTLYMNTTLMLAAITPYLIVDVKIHTHVL